MVYILVIIAVLILMIGYGKIIKIQSSTDKGKYISEINGCGYNLNYVAPFYYDHLNCAISIRDIVTNTDLKTVKVEYSITLSEKGRIIDIDNLTLSKIKNVVNKDSEKRSKIIKRDKERIK